MRMRMIVFGLAVAMGMRVNDNLPGTVAFAADFGFDFSNAAALGAIRFLVDPIFSRCHLRTSRVYFLSVSGSIETRSRIRNTVKNVFPPKKFSILRMPWQHL
jgi:hypothetical protein